jgi:hypothetical protein
MSALTRWLPFPVEEAPPPCPPPAAVELAARALAAVQLGDQAAAGAVVDRMLGDDWWRGVLEAAVLREMARSRS